jgi:hypothetical protein
MPDLRFVVFAARRRPIRSRRRAARAGGHSSNLLKEIANNQ